MTRYLRASGARESFGYKYVAALDEIYIGATVYLTAAFLADVASSSQDFFEVFDLYGLGGMTPVAAPDNFESGGAEGIYLQRRPTPEWRPEQAPAIPDDLRVGAHEIDLHIKLSTDTYVYVIDGVTHDLSGHGHLTSVMSQIDAVAFGAIFSGANLPSYLTNLRVGTTGIGSTDILSDDLSSGTLDSFDGTFGNVANAKLATNVIVKIYDLASNELADISGIALEKTLSPRHNASRSLVISQVPSADPLLTTTIADDGYPNLRKGNRKIVMWEDDVPVFHGRIFTIERTGDGTTNTLTITASDPWMELGFDSDDRAGRPVRDQTGNYIDPDFSYLDVGSGVCGPALILDVLANSQVTDPTLGEGPLPIDTLIDPSDTTGLDLSVADSMDWPVLIGDLFQQLVDTGVVDIRMRPLDIGESTDPYAMVAVSAVASLGSDLSGTVHFDYWTGSFNAKACRHVEDFKTINNKLFDYLGPRVDTEHWRGSIAPDSPGVTIDPAASRALYGGPGPNPGEFMSIRVFDSLGNEDSSRPLYIALYNAELGYRVEPRDLLYITPNPDSKALFDALHDFDVGDLITVNVGAEFGLEIAATQRVMGFDKTWDRQGVARVSELLTTADVSLS